MKDFVIIVVLALILGLVGWYLYRSKKAGRNCIGCPHNGSCPSQKGKQCCICPQDEQ